MKGKCFIRLSLPSPRELYMCATFTSRSYSFCIGHRVGENKREKVHITNFFAYSIFGVCQKNTEFVYQMLD